MDEYTRTRRSLHGVAELLMAGPQYRRSGTIRLAPSPAGFATVAEPAAAVHADTFVVDGAPVGTLRSVGYAELARTAGLAVGRPEGVYRVGSAAEPQDRIHVDAEHAATIAHAFETGRRALLPVAPAEQPVLWPEHFDLAITVDRINFGVSPGDELIPEPYAYVGPHEHVSGPFWNQPFGAARPLREFAGFEAVAGFFGDGAREMSAVREGADRQR